MGTRWLTIAIATAACGRAPTTASSQPAPNAPAPVTAPSEASRWPADAVSVLQGGHDGFVISYVRSMYTNVRGTAPPPCIGELTAHLDAQYQLELGDDRAPAHLYVGSFDRDAIERCLHVVGDTFREAGFRLDVDRDGDLTRITQVTHKTAAAWMIVTPTEVVVTGDPARTRAVAANAHPMAVDAPLARLWARTSGEMRAATVLDYSSKPLGVPSTGWILGIHAGEARLTMQAPVRVQYATQDDATRALAALAAKPSQPGASPALARLVELLGAHREGSEVVIDVGGIMREPDGLATAQQALGIAPP